ncbi:hypothetical protein [Streptomyces sp. CRN 30]|uniref:hypothetical protein n=1 Tax=Streptomyces sp. CRN 30 TaxID=3075613 RepID=UPI002A810B03|nr:hypothetical protein [Streptomyces sp. CRN 30]
MVRKKMEGDEQQRRAAALEARRSGDAPSAEGVTTGASKQRRHVSHRNAISHEEKIGSRHRGKQQWRTGDLAERAVGDPSGQGAERTFTGRGHPGYGERHEQVFKAVSAVQEHRHGEAGYLEEISRAAGLPVEDTRVLLHDLTQVHGLVTELAGSDDPDLGPRFEVKPGL